MNQSFNGRSSIECDLDAATGALLVAVRCRVDDREDEFDALLDTAGQWCVLPPIVARELGYDLEVEGDTRLHSRFGTFTGTLIRIPMIFVADEGEPAEVDATWFLAPDWPGPMVIGWKGCLERMRFAFDPEANDFYFAEY